MKKSSRQGFTLIELLAAIVILGIIVALSIPQISNLIDSNNEKKYETYEDTIETSAKLYTDAYTEDMFGNNESGCYDIPYEDLSNKNLVKDINVSDVTCTGGADKKTFVRVYKSGDHYNYKVSMYCTTKDGGTVQYENNIPSIDGVCDGTQMDDEGPTITLSLDSGKSLDGWMTGAGEKVNVVVYDAYGLLENIKLKYAWSTSSTQSGVAASDWKTKSFGNERYEETVSFKASVPENVNDNLYLHVVPEMVRDANGNYTTESQLFGPFRLDNTEPTCELSLSAEPTGNDDWYVVEPTVTMVVNDEHGDIKNYGMTSKKNPSTSDYEKILSKVQGDVKSVTWSGFVVDEAGNRTTCKTASFKVDTTKPSTPTKGAITLQGSTKEPSLTAVEDSTDKTSGYKETKYLVIVDDATVPAKTDSRFAKSRKFTRDCGKSYYAYAIAIDNAGNISDVYKIGDASDEPDVYSDWGKCTKTCGTGTQTRTNTCALVTTGFEQECNKQECCSSVTYKDGETCTKKCGSGTYNRQAYSAYDGSRCKSKDETSGGSACNTQTCCTKDTVTYKDGTSCAGACGTGTYNQLAYSTYDNSVRCESFDLASGGASCNTGITCCTKDTITYQDGKTCSGACGTGTYNRLAYSTLNNQRCKDFDETSGGSACDTGITCCTKDTIKYEDGSTCAGACGSGTKNRLAYSTLNNQRCESFDQTSGGSKCETGIDCCGSSNISYGSWSGWSSCTATCGGGTKSRSRSKTSTLNSQDCGTDWETVECGTSPCCSESNPYGCEWVTSCRDGATFIYTSSAAKTYAGTVRHGWAGEDKLYILGTSGSLTKVYADSADFYSAAPSNHIVWIYTNCIGPANQVCPYTQCPG